jgi:hypothetical protein
MPAGFPAAPFDAVYEIVQSLTPKHAELRLNFVGAWLALGYRYRAMAEYGEEFTKLFVADGPGPSMEKRYLQERALFGFFGNGFTTFEALFFGLFAIGAMVAPADLPLATAADQQSVSPNSTVAAYKRVFRADPFVTALEALTSDVAFKNLREVRNVLTHRVVPARQFYIGSLPPAEWKIVNIALDATTTTTREAEVSRLLMTALSATELFARTQLR